ncbi:hypothetical protein HPG69_016286, partial [Diceros bicornis minor]
VKEENDLKFLAAGTYLGGTNLGFQMEQHNYRRKNDDVHTLNLKRTWRSHCDNQKPGSHKCLISGDTADTHLLYVDIDIPCQDEGARSVEPRRSFRENVLLMLPDLLQLNLRSQVSQKAPVLFSSALMTDGALRFLLKRRLQLLLPRVQR